MGSGRRTTGALALALAVAATTMTLPWAGAAAAAPSDPADGARPGHHASRAGRGTDDDGSRRQTERAGEERDLALAATWHLDPALLRPLPTDTPATTAARQRLAGLDTHLQDVVAAYDVAKAAADRARTAAQRARAELDDARAAARAAAVQYEKDRALLDDVITEAYTTDQLGPVAMVLTADSDEDMAAGLTMLQELSDSQSSAVLAAERSRDRLRRAQAAVAAAEQRARDDLARARSTLADATAARAQVLIDVREARDLLQGSVLADQAARAAVAGSYLGVIRFPLPAGTSFVDQHNFGHRSHHWASVHTGDDFSTACGTTVLAATDGTVVVRTDQGWSGRWLVMVSTGPGSLSTWYAHMQTLLVSDGEQVRAGEPIGQVGDLGNATGCHLHFEVHPSGGSIYEDDTDPGAWLEKVGAYPGQS